MSVDTVNADAYIMMVWPSGSGSHRQRRPAAGAEPVLDDHQLPERGGELRQDARHRVGALPNDARYKAHRLVETAADATRAQR
jgi:hypothetical protein